MSVTVFLSAQAKPDRIIDLKKFLERCLRETRLYEGFLSIDIYEDLSNLGSLVFYENWESIKAYEAYIKWRTEQGVMDEISAMLVSPPKIKYYERVDI